MMQAAIELGTHLGDTQVVADATAAFTRAQGAINSLLWNSTLNYFRAYTGGDAIMGDCLYGQVVGHHHGLGWLMPQEQLAQHLAAELKYNGNEVRRGVRRVAAAVPCGRVDCVPSG